MLAQCYFEELEFVKAGNLFVKVKTKEPELALRFSYLSSTEGERDTIVRAAGAEETPPVFWDSKE